MVGGMVSGLLVALVAQIELAGVIGSIWTFSNWGPLMSPALLAETLLTPIEAGLRLSQWGLDYPFTVRARFYSVRATLDIRRWARPQYSRAWKRLTWCPGWESNPHSRCREKDFKSFASAGFATRAGCALLDSVTKMITALWN